MTVGWRKDRMMSEEWKPAGIPFYKVSSREDGEPVTAEILIDGNDTTET